MDTKLETWGMVKDAELIHFMFSSETYSLNSTFDYHPFILTLNVSNTLITEQKVFGSETTWGSPDLRP